MSAWNEHDVIRAQLAARWRDLLPPLSEKSQERSSCQLHPDWKPNGPPAPASLCPHCQSEAEARYGAKPKTIEVPHPLMAHSTPALDSRWESFAEKRGLVLSGSEAEEAALARIDELREEEEREESRHGGGRVVTQRFEGGKVVAFVAPRRRGRRGALGLMRSYP